MQFADVNLGFSLLNSICNRKTDDLCLLSLKLPSKVKN